MSANNYHKKIIILILFAVKEKESTTTTPPPSTLPSVNTAVTTTSTVSTTISTATTTTTTLPSAVNSIHNVGSMAVNSIGKTKVAIKSRKSTATPPKEPVNGHAQTTTPQTNSESLHEDSSNSEPERKSPPKRKPPKVWSDDGGDKKVNVVFALYLFFMSSSLGCSFFSVLIDFFQNIFYLSLGLKKIFLIVVWLHYAQEWWWSQGGSLIKQITIK